MMGRVRVTSLVNIISVIRQLLFFSKKRETAPYPSLPSPQFFLQKINKRSPSFSHPKNPPQILIHWSRNMKLTKIPTHLFDKFRLMVQFIFAIQGFSVHSARWGAGTLDFRRWVYFGKCDAMTWNPIKLLHRILKCLTQNLQSSCL